MRLSKNFTLEELITYRHVTMLPTCLEHFDNLQALCDNVLQPIREHFKKKVNIISAFRNEYVNSVYGCNQNSPHLCGLAAQFSVQGVFLKKVFEWVKNSSIEYDLCMITNEHIYITHARPPEKNRRQTLDHTDVPL